MEAKIAKGRKKWNHCRGKLHYHIIFSFRFALPFFFGAHTNHLRTVSVTVSLPAVSRTPRIDHIHYSLLSAQPIFFRPPSSSSFLFCYRIRIHYIHITTSYGFSFWFSVFCYFILVFARSCCCCCCVVLCIEILEVICYAYERFCLYLPSIFFCFLP